jgi:nitrous oxidase accessory protein
VASEPAPARRWPSRRGRIAGSAGILAAWALGGTPASAGVIEVAALPGAAQAAIAASTPGDVVLLGPGRHRGPIEVDRAITLRGVPGAAVDGGGAGSALRVTAADAVVEDLTVERSGGSVQDADAGVRVIRASGVTLRRVQIRDVLYGVYAERAERLQVEDCRLTGRAIPTDPSATALMDHSAGGNGIHLWYSPDAQLDRNEVERFQDGIYLSFANRTRATGNRLFDSARYGLHTMYCQGTSLVGNLFTRNAAGCAIMFTNGLTVERNSILHNRGPRTYGFLLRDCSAGRFIQNQVVDNTVAVFMDNSNRNAIRGNLFQDNGWGLLIFSSCAGNETSGNTFLNNDYPVALDMRYSSNRFDDGRRGNFWSENAPYDLDADGVSDIPFSPVSAFAFLSKQYPDLSILAKSPAVAAVTVAERVFPALRPSDAVDRFPLVEPVALPHERDHAKGGNRPDWAAAAVFASLLAAGLCGLGWKGRA